ncbi:CTTNBP2 N-terminal-like protein [Mytilus coruscus]|uniref:Cortactin-binding protein 2 n=1 Tax=Mytilus coruscus TaxID=42192 RepID=A0A6J8E2B5_MYTCO|nr:CTTNBP2 N-terminal-like protein [Mytilus coruscus]
MAGRNVRQQQPSIYDTPEKLQSNTLKRHPKMDLSKNELLKLLSYLEGELQAREVVIATLRSEKAKQLIYQAKYGKVNTTDPFLALQRDTDRLNDNSFDEGAIKSMYDNQLAQLENLIATQRKAQMKMREQLSVAEKKHNKVCQELEDEKRKHAQDTAQGDDVTYMLEKERERLKQEIDYEKNQNKKIEKDLKKTLASLEEERANSVKHKQVAVMLIKEQKKLIEKLILDREKLKKYEQALKEEKNKHVNVVEGLVEESKKSLKMEAVMEKQLSDFDVEREQLKGKLVKEEAKNKEHQIEIESLKKQIEALQKHVHKDSIQSIEIRSTASPRQSADVSLVTSPKIVPKQSDMNVITDTQNRVMSPVYTESEVQRKARSITMSPDRSKETYARKSNTDVRFAPVGAASNDKMGLETSRGGSKMSSISSTTISGGGKVLTVNVSGHPNVSLSSGNVSPRKMVPTGRGTPPPLPPNKPVLSAVSTSKPAPPPKSSPENAALDVETPPTSSDPLEFLGPEMADLQQLLTTIMSDSDTTHTEIDPTSSLLQSDSSSSLSSSSSANEIEASPLHKFAFDGNFDSLRKLILECDADVNLPLKDGSTPLLKAAENGHDGCVKLLLEYGANPNSVRDDRFSPLHVTAIQGYKVCLKLLLDHGASPNHGDHNNWTALHLAATEGHTECCHLLLEHGAKLNSISNTTWTPLHSVVHSNLAECLRFLLTYHPKSASRTYNLNEVVDLSDKDGWTITHIAATHNTPDCLDVILNHCNVDLEKKDRWGRTVLDVASPQCNQYLRQIVDSKDVSLSVILEISYVSTSNTDMFTLPTQKFNIGSVLLAPNTPWVILENKLQFVLTSFLSQLDVGLKTKRTSRLDPEIGGDSMQYSLGIKFDILDRFMLGRFAWNKGDSFQQLPYDVMCNNKANTVSIIVENSIEALACDVLFPVSVLQNYIRLLEHYKSVVFYGPDSTGKTYLARRLANYIAKKEQECGKITEIHHVSLHENYSHNDLVKLLKNTGCMVKDDNEEADCKAPILILDNLDNINIAELFGPLLNAVEHRGQFHSFTLNGATDEGGEDLYFFVDNLYILGTMNKSRSIGLDFGIQQRFRWVHLRIDIEPIRNLLARHLLRRFIHINKGQLPSSDSTIFRAVEWVVCVWQRLNDGLGKLGLPDVVFGPYQFLSCPLETNDPQSIQSWMATMWNNVISPVVKEAVIKNSGKDASDLGQQKVVSTALYVLMQRAVVPGCPLSGQDKEHFLHSLSGTNELDIPIKQDKTTKSTGLSRRSRENSPVRIQRNSIGSDIKPDIMLASSSIKRRSLSDISLKSTFEAEEIKQDTQQAKVPKLEIRSPVIFSRNSPLRASTPAGNYWETDNNSSHIIRSYSVSNRPNSSQGRTSSNIPQVSRRTRSSENLTSVGSPYGFNKFNNNNITSKLKSPFSFSLATPTSSLTSFKFLEAKSKVTTGSHIKRTARRSLDSADRSFSALPSRNERRSFQQDHYLGTNC